MLRVAAYARYSTDKQRDTSIDDQLRRCHEVAERLNCQIDPNLIFIDEALSATTKHIQKRAGYNNLLAALRDGKIDVLISDEISRFARNPRQKVELQEMIEETGVRVITANGIDTAQDNWQLNFGFQGLISEQAIRDTQHRVTRGMVGQLERGFMVGRLVYGYRVDREHDDKGNRIGTHWTIHQVHADIVKEIFQRRQEGYSLGKIANTLNSRNIPPPGQGRKGEAYWRPGTIDRILENSIYRGVFIWHGSKEFQKNAKKRRRDPEIKEFQRPGLRVVSDELWYACNKKKNGRARHASGKHAFSGLVLCGSCGAMLSVSMSGNSPSLHCAQCYQARRAGMERGSLGYISITGLQHVLEAAISTIFMPTYHNAFKERLNSRLNQGGEEEIKQAKEELDKAVRICARLLNAIKIMDCHDDALANEYKQARYEQGRLEDKFKSLKSRNTVANKDVIKKQLEINPDVLIKKLWDATIPPEKLRTILHGIFDEIIFLEKISRFQAIISVKLSPGIIAASLSSTQVVDEKLVVLRYLLTTGASRPTVWKVELLQD